MSRDIRVLVQSPTAWEGLAEPQAPTYPNPTSDTNLLPDYLSERLLGQECKALTLADL